MLALTLLASLSTATTVEVSAPALAHDLDAVQRDERLVDVAEMLGDLGDRGLDHDGLVGAAQDLLGRADLESFPTNYRAVWDEVLKEWVIVCYDTTALVLGEEDERAPVHVTLTSSMVGRPRPGVEDAANSGTDVLVGRASAASFEEVMRDALSLRITHLLDPVLAGDGDHADLVAAARRALEGLPVEQTSLETKYRYIWDKDYGWVLVCIDESVLTVDLDEGAGPVEVTLRTWANLDQL